MAAGAGGLTLSFGTLTLDSTAHLSTPFLTSLAATIIAASNAAGSGDVVLSAPLTIGQTVLFPIEAATQLSSVGHATLTIAGPITGQSGAILDITAGHVALTNGTNVYDSTEIAGGLLEIASTGAAGSGMLAFLSGTIPDTLQIDAGVVWGNMIAGFGSNDLIDLRGFGFDASDKATYNDGRLTLNDSHGSYVLDFAGSYTASNFAITANGHGGTAIMFHS